MRIMSASTARATCARWLMVGLLGVVSAQATRAAAGDFDLSFDSDGKQQTDFAGLNDEAHSVRIHGGPLLRDRIVVAGSVNGSSAGPSRNFGLVRYLANGTVDLPGIQTDFFGYDDYINAVVVQPDEKVVVAGCATQATGDPFKPTRLQMALARYHLDGSLDLSFGHEGNGKVTVVYGGDDSCIFALAIQHIAAGAFKLVVAGYSGANFRLTRYFDTGLVDSTFGDNGGTIATPFEGVNLLPIPNALIVQSDGKLVAAGGTDRASASNSDFAVARYSADGIPDSSFGNGSGKVTVELGGEDRAFGLIELTDRSLVLAGYSDVGGGARDFALARLDPSGTLLIAFNGTGKLKTDFAGGSDSAYALVLQPDGKFVAAGTGTTATGMRGFALARYNALGELDQTFGTGGKQIADPSPHSLAIAFALAQQTDGKFVAAGIGFGTSQDFAVARFLGDGSSNRPPAFTSITVDTPLVTEGSVAQLTVGYADPDPADQLTLTVNWGDSLTPQVFSLSGSPKSITHRYADDPPAGPDEFLITLMLQDNNGAQSEPQTRSIVVNNVPPSVSIAVSPTTFNAGATTTLSGTVSDPGADAHTVSINWGDGSGDQQVPMTAGTTAIPAQPHIYARAGSYTINVAATDDDGGMSVVVSQAVTVFEVLVPPAAPSRLAATAVSRTQILVTWTDSSNNEDGFEVQRCNRFGKMCQTFTAPANAMSYSDLTVRRNTTYLYSVRASNRAGFSAYAGPVSATTPLH